MEEDRKSDYYLGKDCCCGKPMLDGEDNKGGYNGDLCFGCRDVCGLHDDHYPKLDI